MNSPSDPSLSMVSKMFKHRTLLLSARVCSRLGYMPSAAYLIKKAIAAHPNPGYRLYHRAAAYLRQNGEFDLAATYDIKKRDAARIRKLQSPEQISAYLDAYKQTIVNLGDCGPAQTATSGSKAAQIPQGVPEILALTAAQSGGRGSSRLALSLTVFEGTEVESLRLKTSTGWLQLGGFEKSSTKLSGNICRYEKTVGLEELASQLFHASLSEENQAPRLHCYVQILSSKAKAPKGAVDVESLEEGRIRYCFPMGKAWFTETDRLRPSQQGPITLTPYLNKSGFLSIATGDSLPKPKVKIYNDSLNIAGGCLQIYGRVFAQYASFTGARLVLQGRTTGYRRAVNVSWSARDAYSARLAGKNAYLFSAEYDFSPDLDKVRDDVVDLYLEMDNPYSADIVRARIGKTSRRTQSKTRGGIVQNERITLSIAPYYTYLAEYPSLQLEIFDTGAYELLAKALKKGRKNKRRSPRPVWLIGEMRYKAQDNGLHFFRYMRDHHPEIDAYYVIEPDSPERANLAGYDHVIDFRSKEHVDITLRADVVACAHSASFILPTIDKRLEKITRFSRVFLQHGVIAQKWIAPVYGVNNRSGFFADKFLVSSPREKAFVVHDLGFKPQRVMVTGLPRFDSLFADDVSINKKQLFIMPTWRPWLQDGDTFQDSDYYQSWMGLLAGRELKELKDKHGLELIFCLHPNMRQYNHLFQDAGVKIVTQGEVDVQHLIKESAVLLTDLSSVAMDFAFLHKPVVYYQFDAQRFPPPHADALTELPGPVLNNLSAVIRALDEAFANGGRMLPEYQRRADRFVAYRDTGNCERVFEAIRQPNYRAPWWQQLVESRLAQKAYKRWRKHASYLPIMRRVYHLLRCLPLDKNTIVFESNLARSFGDSPRAIYNELVRQGDTRRKIIVSNKSVRHLDENTRVVKRHSPAFMYYMARSKYWINNQNFPPYLRRRRGGIYIQTWHGTPLKRMLFDQENFFGRDSGYIDRVTQSVAQWGVLISPNPHTTKAMRSSYRFTGPVKEIGYPRNDVLLSEEKHLLADKVRHGLGLPDNKCVVLYAPTFRDDKPTKNGRFAFEWPFDPHEWVNEVGKDVVLLVRTHNLISNRLRIPDELRQNVIDVSNYPDIQELFLISDMLVTDYSSSFFDYAILQRPILFFAYDLENYRDNLRGFYLDYDRDLPGPIVTDNETLFAKVREYADPATRPDNPIAPAFLARFAPYEDGKASQRVIEQLLGGIK